MWIWFGWPLPVRLSIALILVAGASLFGFIALFVTRDLPPNLRRGLAAGTGLVLLIATVLAVQGDDSATTGNGPQGLLRHQHQVRPHQHPAWETHRPRRRNLIP